MHKAQAEMVPEKTSALAMEVGFTEKELISLTKDIDRNFNGEKRVILSQVEQDIDLLFPRISQLLWGLRVFWREL